MGILVASIVAAAIGVLILRSAREPAEPAGAYDGQAHGRSSEATVEVADREQSE